MELADETSDGGGSGPGGETIGQDDPRFDGYVDGFEKSTDHQHELSDPNDGESGRPAPKAPPVNPNAPMGSKTNPVVVPSRRGAQY